MSRCETTQSSNKVRTGPSGRRTRTLICVLGLITIACMLPPAGADEGKPPPAERLQLCAGCHNADGNSVIPENPKLAGLDTKYLAKQLADFKAGRRVSPIMGAMIAQVGNDELGALAEYYGGQKPAPGMVTDGELAALGKVIFDDGIVGSAVPACSGCHNDDGSGTAKYPRLAGQHSAYVIQQMMNFKSGGRTNDLRQVMRAVAARMNEREIRAVAEYIASLNGSNQ